MPRPVLPRKPSALIRVGLADLAKMERTKGVEIFMPSWVLATPTKDGKSFKPCAVCFAGSVMVSSFPGAMKKYFDSLYPEEISVNEFAIEPYTIPIHSNDLKALNALNSIRVGDIEDMIREMEINPTGEKRAKVASLSRLFQDITRYENDPREWRFQMNVIADALERIGL